MEISMKGITGQMEQIHIIMTRGGKDGSKRFSKK